MDNEIISLYLEQVQERLTRMEEKLDDLQSFKSSTIVTARFTSFLVSSVLGFVSLVSSGIVTYLVTIRINQK